MNTSVANVKQSFILGDIYGMFGGGILCAILAVFGMWLGWKLLRCSRTYILMRASHKKTLPNLHAQTNNILKLSIVVIFQKTFFFIIVSLACFGLGRILYGNFYRADVDKDGLRLYYFWPKTSVFVSYDQILNVSKKEQTGHSAGIVTIISTKDGAIMQSTVASKDRTETGRHLNAVLRELLLVHSETNKNAIGGGSK